MCVKQQNNWMYLFIIFNGLGFYDSELCNNMCHLAILKVFILGRSSFLVKSDVNSLHTECIPNALKLYNHNPFRSFFCFQAVYQMIFGLVGILMCL